MLCYFGGLSGPPFSVSTADTCVSGGGISLLTSFRCMGITVTDIWGRMGSEGLPGHGSTAHQVLGSPAPGGSGRQIPVPFRGGGAASVRSSGILSAALSPSETRFQGGLCPGI